MFYRGRRLRRTTALRSLVREHSVTASDLIMPYFVVETSNANFANPIASMPGQYQFSLTKLLETVSVDVAAGLECCLLFGIPAQKDPTGSQAWAEKGIVQQAVRALKKEHPNLVVITDLCLCEYTSHGHCGLLSPEGEVQNDPTLKLLCQIAVAQAAAGADIIAPSDMMDGRVEAIRTALDDAGFTHIPVMSYAVKYASAYYGPFREAAESAPAFGDRKAYQMDPANRREALREAAADVAEGADFLIVKPAGPYMDIIRDVRDTFRQPVVAYQVSGEYSMIRAAGLNGWIDEDRVVMEALTGFKRAGADLVITYFAADLLRRRIL